MTSLLETALNGMGLGSKISDIDGMYARYKLAGDKLAEMLLLDLSMELEDLGRHERMRSIAANNLARALQTFQDNPTISNAEWLGKYGAEIERYARQAQDSYTRVGKIWRMWVAADR